MNDEELLRSLGKAAREDRDAPPSPDEKALEGALDDAFEDRLFAALGVAEAGPARAVEAPRNVIPFPPNRARTSSRVFAGIGMAFAAAAAVVLVQRGGSEPLGTYELTAQSARLERGVDEDASHVTASVGRPLTLVLRPAEKTTVTPDVRVVVAFGANEQPLEAQVEAAPSGSLRVTVVPGVAGKGELRVRLAPKGDSKGAHAVVITKPLEVREAP